MAEFIDKQEVLDILRGKGAPWDAYAKVQSLPAADVRPVVWIPVTERLPESHQYVLCCGRRGGMFVGWVASLAYNGDKKATAFDHGGSGRYITHWMPLPPAPKEET